MRPELKILALVLVLILLGGFANRCFNNGFRISMRSRRMGVSFTSSGDGRENKTKELEIEENTDLEIGYENLEIGGGEIVLKVNEGEREIFARELNQDSPGKASFVIEDLNPGKYEVELVLEKADSGRIDVFWDEGY
ncbi:MAG: hypothetical protein ACOC5A_01700 [Halanaerobiales bacterium]